MGNRNSPTSKVPPGWFSRRHQTRESHDAAVAQWHRDYNSKRNPPQPPYNTHKEAK